jgi:Oxidoreductase family, NAD-binding Rossmann fold/Oxidoreductase family, C-terminal alpha/beta domain
MSNPSQHVSRDQHFSRRSFLATTAAVTASLATRSSYAMANESIGLGVIGCGWRGGDLMGQFSKLEGVDIVAICDVDPKIVGLTSKRFPKAKTYSDLRKLIDDPNVDAVVVATCNHWHCLAAIWAMQAGKDVYVEKPLSHTQWEGRQTVNAARQYKRICQVGTQQRSDPMQAEIKKFLHDDKTLGAIQSVRVNRFGIRPSIGKRDKPLEIDKDFNYELWLGPAADEPIFRDKLHYDWHWVWNTGSGEMGNWGVHVLDDVRNNVFRDSVALPKRIMAGGTRTGLNDAGETPNVHFVHFDTGLYPVTIALSNLPGEVGGKKSPKHPGPGSGYIVYCEGGQFHGQRGQGKAMDLDGKVVKQFKGDSKAFHQKNFLDAVRTRDSSILNTDVAVGNDSSGWCNLANVAFRYGAAFNRELASQVKEEVWSKTVDEMDTHLKTFGSSIESSEVVGSPMLTIDGKTEQFVGEGAEIANKYLKRVYRKGYEVPAIEA